MFESPSLNVNLIKLVVDAIDVQKDFPKLFVGLGKLNVQHHINLTDDARPVCLYAARKVPHPLLPRVKDELKRMEDQGVISKVTQPTDWCSWMVVLPKPNGKVRICVYLTQLNKAVRREVHPMKSVDENLAKLGNATVFSKLDANSGFWQLPLDEESKLLTTFINHKGDLRSTESPSAFHRHRRYSLAPCHRYWKEWMVSFATWMTFGFMHPMKPHTMNE